MEEEEEVGLGGGGTTFQGVLQGSGEGGGVGTLGGNWMKAPNPRFMVGTVI